MQEYHFPRSQPKIRRRVGVYRLSMKFIAILSFTTVFLTLLVLKTSGQSQDPNKKPKLNFYGNGNIQKSLDRGEKIPASTGLGVNYTHWFHPDSVSFPFDKLELDVSINIASTVDTIKAEFNNGLVTNSSNFGSSILTPLNSGQAVKIALRMNFRKPLVWIFVDGVKAKYIGSNRNWQVGNGTSSQVILGTNNYFRAGLFQEFLPKELLDEYSINLGLYLAYNSIKGDIGQKVNRNFRHEILSTYRKNFLGPEVALEVRLLNIRAEFAYSWLLSNEEVPGLTGGRLITTISFVGGFGLLIDKQKKTNEKNGE